MKNCCFCCYTFFDTVWGCFVSTVLTKILTVEKLAAARGFVLIGIFVVAALLTPPDAISQSIMAIPMYTLYEGGLLMSRLLVKMRRKQDQEAEA